MRLAFGVEAYREFPFEHALQRLSEFGYAGIDLPVDRPFAFPPPTTMPLAGATCAGSVSVNA